MQGICGRARRHLAAVVASVGALAIPGRLIAQTGSTTLTLSPSVLSFASPTVADYTNGYLCAGSVTASVTHNTGGTPSDKLVIRLAQSTAITSTPSGHDKPLADFLYSTNSNATCSTGTWTAVPALSATGATVHAAAAAPYSQIIYFRLKLTWTVDRGGESYALPSVAVYLNNP